MNLIRLYHTVRYLQPRQILGQVRHRLRAKLENPARFRAREAPPFPGCAWRPVAPFLAPGTQTNQAGEILAGRITFLNNPLRIGWLPDWERAGLPKLWLYNLHYFEWIWAFAGDDNTVAGEFEQQCGGYEQARAAVLDWTRRHPLGRGKVGWEPYPVSLRLMNWCAVFFERHRLRTLADVAFLEQLWASIWLQAEWLMAHQETHLLGNHLLENGAALAWAGACFAGPEGARWLKTGIRILREQVKEQILDDGLHFERSPMYHSRIVYLFLQLYHTGDERLREMVGPVLPGMLRALAEVCHPDGQIALLNDSAFGIYNHPRELFAQAAGAGLFQFHDFPGQGAMTVPTGLEGHVIRAPALKDGAESGSSPWDCETGCETQEPGRVLIDCDCPRLAELNPTPMTRIGLEPVGPTGCETELGNGFGVISAGPWALPQAGYYGFRDADGSYVVCDAGPIGPDYIPGHAHADTFSFELSLRGQRVIVDSGVHDYEWSELRRASRSTKAHNTVEIAECDQSEIWGAFRVARRAAPREVSWEPHDAGFRLSGWHDGYLRLAGKPVHQRIFDYRAGGFLTVTDRVTSARPIQCRAFLHLHPDCRFQLNDNGNVSIRHPAGCFNIIFNGKGRLECQEGWYFPEFYQKHENTVLVFSWNSAESPEIITKIEPQS